MKIRDEILQVDPEDLLKEINNFQHFLQSAYRLLFQPKRENNITFEQITKGKADQKLNQINFVIEIPITQRENNDYFQLFSSYPFPKKITSPFFLLFVPFHISICILLQSSS